MSQAQTQRDGTRELGTTSTIGPYEVLSRLALGGMAELLLARRVGIEGFRKLVVLKRILPQHATNPDFVEMFLHEARLAAALEHPNIVQVFDIGKSGDDYYFAMAYLHGKDVLAILRELSRTKRRMPVEHALAIGSGIAAGLHHAHEQLGFDGRPLEIVHRDVSPANAIVTYDGTVKLVDFGIAKAAQTSETRAGVRKGKAAYMSPEQCRGDPLDRRTDIWSLGVVLYELFTMTRLFRADNDLAVMHRIVSQDAPSPLVANSELAPALAAIVERCLQRDRSGRYATAAALQHDLDACGHELGLRPSAAGLSEFLRGLFGVPALPWTPTDPAVTAASVTSSVDVGPEAFAELPSGPESTRNLGGTPPPVADTRLVARTAPYPSAASGLATPSLEDDDDPPLAGGRSWGTVAVLGAAAVCIAGAAVWGLWPRGHDAPAVASATVKLAAETTAPTPPDAGEVERLLQRVNLDDPAANPVIERHALLAKLRTTAAASRIDEALQVRLDLQQASSAARPCETFATALERAAQDRVAFAETIATAAPPDPTTHPTAGRAPDRPCDDLASRVLALREPAVAIVPTADDSTTGPRQGSQRSRKRPAGQLQPANAEPVEPTARRPAAPSGSPTPAKLDDELRPFRK